MIELADAVGELVGGAGWIAAGFEAAFLAVADFFFIAIVMTSLRLKGF